MRLLVQRVSEASVTIEGKPVGRIGSGLLVFVGVRTGDTEREASHLAEKLAKLRIFEDNDGRMNRNMGQHGGSFLVVSQFTLYGDCRKGNRPGYKEAAGPETAEPLYNRLIDQLKDWGYTVESGRFGADMEVGLVNDGPVTLWLEREADGA